MPINTPLVHKMPVQLESGFSGVLSRIISKATDTTTAHGHGMRDSAKSFYLLEVEVPILGSGQVSISWPREMGDPGILARSESGWGAATLTSTCAVWKNMSTYW
jgi:hypothetical protein